MKRYQPTTKKIKEEGEEDKSVKAIGCLWS